jgi:hypothetical protein
VAPTAHWVLEIGEYPQRFKLAPGQYFLVVDNSDRLGQAAPAWNPLAPVGSGAVGLDYVLELAEE